MGKPQQLIAQGKIVAQDQRGYWVEFVPQSACGHCATGESCSTAQVAKMIGKRQNRIYIEKNPADPFSAPLHPGDGVLLGFDGHKLNMLIALSYGLPLLGIIVGAALLQAWGDITALAGASVGFMTGWLLAKWQIQPIKPQMLNPQPQQLA